MNHIYNGLLTVWRRWQRRWNLKRNLNDGVVVAEVSTTTMKKKVQLYTSWCVKARETYTFDSIDLIAMEIYELLLL